MGTMWLFQGMVNDMPFVTIMASDYVEFNVYQCLVVAVHTNCTNGTVTKELKPVLEY